MGAGTFTFTGSAIRGHALALDAAREPQLFGAGVMDKSRNPGRSRSLRRSEDFRPVATVCAWFALVIAEWIWAPQRLALVMPLVALTCIIAFLGAVATHNTMHV